MLRKIRYAIRNSFWSDKEQLKRTRVSWKVYCMKKKNCLRLVDPEIAKTNILCKWIVKTIES